MAEEAIVARLKAVLSGDSSQLRRDLDKASKNLEAFSKKATQVGRTLTTRVTLPLVGIGVGAVKVAADFEKSMSKITALVGVAADEVASMEGQVRSMATTFGKSATEAADALFYITSAGLRGSTATDTLAASLKASAIGLGDTATIADLATSALNAYGADVISAGEATDVMTAAVREGKLEASELAGSMGRVLPLSSAMGVSFNEVGAAFAALSRTGTNAAEAATQIRGILSSLLRPTKQSEEAMAGLGLSAEGLRTQIREEGLLATLGTLADKFAGNEAAAAAVFGNIRALSGVLDLMGANVATTEQIFANMADTTGTVDEAFSVMSDTASFKFQQAMAELKETLLTIGQEIMPMVSSAVEFLSDAFANVSQFIKGLPDPVKNTAIALTVFAAAAGPAALALGALTSAGSALMANPMVLTGAIVFGTLATAIGLAASQSREAKERVQSLREEFEKVEGSVATVVPTFETLIDTIGKLFPDEQVDELGKAIDQITGRATIDAAIMKADLSEAFNAIGFDMGLLAKEVTSGGQSFDNFSNQIDDAVDRAYKWEQANAAGLNATELAAGKQEYLTETLRAAGVEINENTQKLIDNVIANDYNTESARNLANELGSVEIAFKALTAETEAEAKALLDSADTLAELRKVYGDNTLTVIDRIKAEADAIDVTEENTYVLGVLNGMLEEVARESAWAAAEIAGFTYESDSLNDVAIGASASLEDMVAGFLAGGEAAGFTVDQMRAVSEQLKGIDGFTAAVGVELDLIGGDAVLKAIDALIKLQMEGMSGLSPDAAQFGFGGALGELMAMRDALAEALANPDSGGRGGGGSGASNAVDEVAEAAKKAQEDVQRFGDSLAGFANRFLGRDFAEAMVEGSFDDITRVFRDLMDDVAYMMKDVTNKSLNAALGDLQGKFSELANLAKLRDELKSQFAEIQDVVADAKSAIKLSLKPDKGPNELSMFVQAQDQVAQARQFVQSLRRLKGLGLPASILQQVVGAGVVDGTLMAKQLLSLSPEDIGQLVSFTREIEQLQQQAGSLVGEALGSGTVEGELSATVDAMQSLTEAIQVDLYSAFATFIQDLGAEITNLKQPDGATAPTPTPAPVPGTPSPSPAPETGGGTGGGSSKYTVKAGDGLWGIAQALLGSGSRWKEIAQLNGKNPDTYGTKWAISPGQMLDIPARAMGGSVSRNKPYLVGELGAELFVPNASGTIVPNGSFGGDTTINVTVNAGMGTDGANVGREIVKALNEYASTNTGRLAPSLVR
jgi:TP901 family phage tail tape measure protein